jgi:hypothetical protein
MPKRELTCNLRFENGTFYAHRHLSLLDPLPPNCCLLCPLGYPLFFRKTLHLSFPLLNITPPVSNPSTKNDISYFLLVPCLERPLSHCSTISPRNGRNEYAMAASYTTLRYCSFLSHTHPPPPHHLQRKYACEYSQGGEGSCLNFMSQQPTTSNFSFESSWIPPQLGHGHSHRRHRSRSLPRYPYCLPRDALDDP